MRPDAVLLDMDGTLVESHAAVERAWCTWAAEHGVDIEQALAVAHGSPAERTARLLLPHASDAEIEVAATRQLALQYDDLGDVVAAPGAAALLAGLDARGVPWAVVTSADVPLARARLGAAGIDPPLLVTCEDVVHGKPAPDPYLLASARLGVRPERCLVVEDAPSGVASGRAAGMVVAGVGGVEADLALAALVDLLDVVDATDA